MSQRVLDPAAAAVELAKELRQRLADNPKIMSSNTKEVTELKKRIKSLEVEIRQLQRGSAQLQSKNKPTPSGWSSNMPSDGKTAAWNFATGVGYFIGSGFGLLKSGAQNISDGMAVRKEWRESNDQVERIYELTRQSKIADPNEPGTEIGGLYRRVIDSEKAVSESVEKLRQAREHVEQLEAEKQKLLATIRYKAGGAMPPDGVTAAKIVVGSAGYVLSSVGSMFGQAPEKAPEDEGIKRNVQPKTPTQKRPQKALGSQPSKIADSASKTPSITMCNLCNVELTSKQARAQHLDSRDHETKVNAILASGLMKDIDGGRCRACDAMLSSDATKLVHALGKKHVKNYLQAGGDRAELRRLLPHLNV